MSTHAKAALIVNIKKVQPGLYTDKELLACSTEQLERIARILHGTLPMTLPSAQQLVANDAEWLGLPPPVIDGAPAKPVTNSEEDDSIGLPPPRL